MCVKARNAFWRLRAQSEITEPAASYMGTLTLAPWALETLEARARLRLAETGRSLPETRVVHAANSETGDKSLVPRLEYFRAIEREGYAEIAKMWKRLRKAEFHIRYFLVAEPHLSEKTAVDRLGVPHWHLLLHHDIAHECEGRDVVDCPCIVHEIKRQWRFGFSDMMLIEDDETGRQKAAAYVAKYISKSMTVRVRASHRYGVNLTQLTPLRPLT